MDKVIHRQMWKKLKFDHTKKWYMLNPESVLENETHTFLWDFDGLDSLFNGISTFVGYLMPKPFS